jgi:hypothetical protein
LRGDYYLCVVVFSPTRILNEGGYWWLMPIILATYKAEIRSIMV